MANETSRKPVIGISIGDINGVNFELIIKTFQDERIFNHFIPVVYASSQIANYHKKALDIKEFNFHQARSIDRIKDNQCNLINCWDEPPRVELGAVKNEAGPLALQSLETAITDYQSGYLDALVTCPINKKTIQSPDFNFQGHTDYLCHKFQKEDVLMFLVSEVLKVGLVTDHIPLEKVKENISQELILSKLRLMNESLFRDFDIRKPKIGVLGLNPHAGDDGLLGEEEQALITPAVNTARDQEEILAFGPFPGDGYFGSGHYKSFDATLAMYHDQGLAPFKALTFGSGVNFTPGLPLVRTSPDHGPAYNLAGKGKADESSFREALFTATEILKNRKVNQEVNENPLQNRMVKEKEK